MSTDDDDTAVPRPSAKIIVDNSTDESSSVCAPPGKPSTATKPANKYELSVAVANQLRDFPEVLDYINLLHRYIKKQRRRLRKFKAKLKKYRAVATQTDDEPPTAAATSVAALTEEKKSLVEEIKEAAELATKDSGFVYDESSGLYYDANTGYYYNAEYSLYYDSTSGIYMAYNQETNTYDFHSKVEQPSSSVAVQSLEEIAIKKQLAKRKRRSKDELKVNISSDLEHLTNCFNYMNINSLRTNALEISQQWPPCMRIIVEQSQIGKIRRGSLHIVTCEGGTLGREGQHHAVLLPDINISKCHLRFTYDTATNQYAVTDLGSRNGTFLNGRRMATAKTESETMPVVHGSRIQIGSIVLLCHVHEGNQTCGHCEPGLVQEQLESKEQQPSPVAIISKTDKYKSELKSLRKKFGVSHYEDATTKLALGYMDRAQKRRETIGSQNHHEKTAVASVNESIPAENKGFKMLAKMGWKEGESLGKDGHEGLLEPVELVSNAGTSGIGSTEPPPVTIENHRQSNNKKIIWKKTQERFQKLPTTLVANVLLLDDDSD